MANVRLLASVVLLSASICGAARHYTFSVARIPELVMVRWIDSKVVPQIAPELVTQGVSGTVVLRVLVAKDGHVKRVVPLSGPAVLFEPYVRAVEQWRYIPYVWDDQTWRVETTVTLVLNKGDAYPFEPQPAGAPGGGYVSVAPLQVTEAQAKLPVRMSAAVLQSLLVRSVPPVYPQQARSGQVSGAVILHVLVGRTGRVDKAHAVSGPEPLRQAAEKAVYQWKYKPCLLNGKPVQIVSTVTVTFVPKSSLRQQH